MHDIFLNHTQIDIGPPLKKEVTLYDLAPVRDPTDALEGSISLLSVSYEHGPKDKDIAWYKTEESE
jgi:hypothetical protein